MCLLILFFCELGFSLCLRILLEHLSVASETVGCELDIHKHFNFFSQLWFVSFILIIEWIKHFPIGDYVFLCIAIIKPSRCTSVTSHLRYFFSTKPNWKAFDLKLVYEKCLAKQFAPQLLWNLALETKIITLKKHR